ncbi:MAG TPA: hypothetical protein VI702_01295, partial [Nitrospiria bacterium]
MTAISKFTIACAAIVMALLLGTGCRSDTKETAGEPPAGIRAAGLDACYNCHADGRLGKYPSLIGNDSVVGVGWLYSPHGNYETNPPVVDSRDNVGDPTYGDLIGTCAGCHDAMEDGRTFSVLNALYGIDALGREDRPVVGCESCHGNGGNHWGVGPIPYPRPGPDRCGQCHNDSLPADHVTAAPEADRIYENY